MKGDHDDEGYDWVERLHGAIKGPRHADDCAGWANATCDGDFCGCGRFFWHWRGSAGEAVERPADEWNSSPKAQPETGAPLETSAALAAKQAKAPVAGGVVQLFPRSMHILAMLSKAGADKYGTTVSTIQFLDTPGAYELHTDAMVRHIVDEALEGPVNHKDGGALHAAQAAWNALARLEVFLKNVEEPNGKETDA